MADNPISIKVSAQVLKFRPGGSPATFEVTVNNDSDRFASFQLEIVAAGANPDPGFQWYSLSPGVSAKKPPGDSTKIPGRSWRIGRNPRPCPQPQSTSDQCCPQFFGSRAFLVE